MMIWSRAMFRHSNNNDSQVTKEGLNFKNKLTPYQGQYLTGRVQQTWLRGRLAYDSKEGGFEGFKAQGRLI